MQGPCSHKRRWKPRHAADRDEENLAAFGSGNVLLVHIPVDLAWSNLACKVRLPRLYLWPCRMQQSCPRHKVIERWTQQEATFKKTWAWALCALLAENSLSVLSASQVVDKHTLVTKHILHATSGSLVPGEMMALVGPSGAGGHPSALLRLLRQALKQCPEARTPFFRCTPMTCLSPGPAQASLRCWISLRSARAGMSQARYCLRYGLSA